MKKKVINILLIVSLVMMVYFVAIHFRSLYFSIKNLEHFGQRFFEDNGFISNFIHCILGSFFSVFISITLVFTLVFINKNDFVVTKEEILKEKQENKRKKLEKQKKQIEEQLNKIKELL